MYKKNKLDYFLEFTGLFVIVFMTGLVTVSSYMISFQELGYIPFWHLFGFFE